MARLYPDPMGDYSTPTDSIAGLQGEVKERGGEGWERGGDLGERRGEREEVKGRTPQCLKCIDACVSALSGN